MHEFDSAIHGGSFFCATRSADPAYPPLGVDLDVDVCVIGGGLAGLTTAREIARRGWSVALLEARRIAWNASGRNTGFVLPGFAQSPDKIIARVGLAHARRLWTLSRMGLDYVRDTIADLKPAGIDQAGGWLSVSKTDQPQTFAADAALLRDEFGENVEFWPTEQVRGALRSPHYFQAVHYPDAFHIHPLNYALALAQSAVEAGARIFEQTPALSIDPSGVRKRIATPSARLRANHVVLAGNVHLDGVMPQIAGTLLPVTTYVAATVPLGERLAEAIPYQGAVSDSEWADNHYRRMQDTRLLWSGRATTWARDPRRYIRRLQRDITRRYPQLGKVEIEFIWNGTLGNTVHRMPQIGEFAPGLWLASGFGGHGLNTTALAGLLISRAIVDSDQSWKAFLPYELIWAGGGTGRVIAQMLYWAQSIRERTAAALSRQAERTRRAEKAHIAAQELRLSAPSPAADSPVASAPADSEMSQSATNDTPVCAADGGDAVGEFAKAPRTRRKRKARAPKEPAESDASAARVKAPLSEGG